ncbi:MAG: hypothetical protein U5L45_18475 [Saprospiraceae bacterium]|nr:hypothetical protein [Saprospiraceae bacterium]
MVQFSAKPKIEPPLLPFYASEASVKGVKTIVFCQKTLNLGYAHLS